MAESWVQVNVPTTQGKKLKTFESLDGGGHLVESEAVTLTDGDGNELLGQKTMADSVPVVFASNQPALPLPAGAATETTLAAALANLETINALVPTKYDYIALGYTGTDLTSVIYKLGGSGGVVVSTLALTYTAGQLTSIART